MHMVFAMVKLDAHAPHRGMTHEFMAQTLGSIFASSYATVDQNRAAGLTCRTWVLAALQKLCGAGLLRLTKEGVAGLEQRVKTITQCAEQLTASGNPTTTITSL